MFGKRLTFCIVACLGTSVVMAQSLGDAARKERERRKKNLPRRKTRHPRTARRSCRKRQAE